MKTLLAVLILTVGCSAQNGVTLASTGAAQTNRPVSVPRFFKQGDIPNFAQAVVAGTPVLTQCDVKNRWADGSLKFAVMSFVVPSLTATPVNVTFQNQSTGNNTGFLAPSDILGAGYNFDAEIQLSGTVSPAISARQMLSSVTSCGVITDFTQTCRYWLQGPVVTAVILEDRLNRSFDVNTDGGTGNPLHPIFEAWCYTATQNCEIGSTLENMWASSNGNNSARNQTYAVNITTGEFSPTVQLTQSSFTHFGYSRWRRAYWITPVIGIQYGWNPTYEESTLAYPQWDLSGTPSAAQIAVQQTCYQKAISVGRFTLPGIDNSAGGDSCGTAGTGGIANYGESQGSANSENWIGPSTKWNYEYFMSGDPTLGQMMTDNADLSGRWPMWIREADANAGSGHFFDKPLTGTVPTQGRFVSVNARQLSTLDPTDWAGATDQSKISDEGCSGMTQDAIHWQSTSALSFGHWVTQDMSHMPEYSYVPYTLTGKYYYLESLQGQAAFELGYRPACKGGNYFHQGELALFVDRTRDTGWYLRTLAYAAFITPDGWPEGPYFMDKLGNELAMLEGAVQIPQTISNTADDTTAYNFGKNTAQFSLSQLTLPAPLNPWTYPIEGSGYATAYWSGTTVNSALSRFMEDIVTFGAGIVNQLGLYDTTPLLGYMAKRSVHEVLDPNFNKYLIGIYTYPIASNKAYIPDFATQQSLYNSNPTAWGLLPKGTEGNGSGCATGPCVMSSSSFSYMFLSFPFYSGLTVDGYSGSTAYTTMYGQMPAINAAMGANFTQDNQYDLTPPVVQVQQQCHTFSMTPGPTNVNIAGGPNFTSLSWNTPANATAYNVYQSTKTGCYTSPLASNIQAAVYTDNTVANGTQYFYVVTSVINGVESGASLETSFTPSNSANLPGGTGWHPLGAGTTPSGVSPNAGGFTKGIYYWNPLANAQEAVDFYENNVTGESVAYSSAVWDSKRDRLVLWGGGHNDGDDPEVYTINLKGSAPAASRIVDPNWTVHNQDVPFDCACKGQLNCGKGQWENGPNQFVATPYLMTTGTVWQTWFEYLPAPEGEPILHSSPPMNTPSCGYSAARLTPNARHTYAMLEYDPTRDFMMSFGGTPSSGNGFYSTVTWMLNLANNTWNKDSVMGPKAGGWAPPDVYDSLTGHFWLYDQNWNVYEYDPSADVYSQRTNHTYEGNNANVALDTVNNRILAVAYDEFGFLDLNKIVDGNINASNAAYTSLASVPACAAAKDSTAGVVYDSKRQVFEVFSGGVRSGVGQPANTFTYVNLGPNPVTVTYQGNPLVIQSLSCQQVSYGTTQGTDYPPNDITRAGSGGAGPSGRFRYVPDLDVIFYLPHPNQQAWILRLE